MDKAKTIVIAIIATVIAVFVILYVVGMRAPKTTTPTPQTGQPTQTSTSTAQPAQTAPDLTNNFSETAAGYVMKYPADWTFAKQGNTWDMVAFSGKEGTDAARASVDIQNIPSTTNGGEYASATVLMTDLKTKLGKAGQDFQLIDEQPLSYMTKAGATLDGDQVLAQYSLNGEAFEQWMIVIPSPDGKYFHAISYTAPVSIFTKYLATAQAMIQSWSMNE